MKHLIVALALAGMSAPALADAPVPVKPEASEQARVSHARDWRGAAKDLVQALKPETLAGKTVSIHAEIESPFVMALRGYLAAELHLAGVAVRAKGGDVQLMVRTQQVDHEKRNNHNMLDPVAHTAAAVGAISVKEVLENTANFNIGLLTMGAVADIVRAVSKQQMLDELVLFASAEGHPFHYAQSYYVPKDELYNYRDVQLKPATLSVNTDR